MSDTITSDIDEKATSKPKEPTVDVESGLDIKQGDGHLVRLDPLGKPLVPAATSDPMDPMNFSKPLKWTIISIVVIWYFLLTYLTTTPIPSFSLLELQFDASYDQVNWSFAISCFGLATSPLFTASLADTYGRRIVTVASTAVAVLASGCTGIKNQSISGYMAARFFQGFGAGPAANVGLSIINDISFEHERGFRVGLWVAAANVGTVLGGVIGGFMATVDVNWVAYHVTIAFAALLIAEIVLLPETLYPRELVVEAEREKAISDTGIDEGVMGVKRTKQLGWVNFRKIPAVPHYKPWDAFVVFGKMWAYPTIVISICSYIFFQYWWIVTVATMIPAAYSEYKIQVQGLFFVGPLIGVVFSELFCSGRLSDWLVTRLARKNGGERVPEMRLWLGYPAAALSTIGLIVWGISVDKGYHWMVGQVALFLFTVGIQVGNTTLSAYMVDNYPAHTISTTTYYTVLINMSAFICPWFIYTWADGVGYSWCFGTQGIICAVCLPPVYFVLQKYGAKWRKPMVLNGKAGDPVV